MYRFINSQLVEFFSQLVAIATPRDEDTSSNNSAANSCLVVEGYQIGDWCFGGGFVQDIPSLFHYFVPPFLNLKRFKTASLLNPPSLLFFKKDTGTNRLKGR